ncbi:MAG: nucleoside deaminase [Erysipelotrichaceae bacterium]|nr:nucleoside deaminase [Erysipelotrichaceae bacterium]
MENTEQYMKIAYQEACKAAKEDEVPVGCVIVQNGMVLAKAHNRKERKQNAVRHAEIEAIEKAVKKIGNWHLDDCDLYVTLEPCMMCAGAIVHSRIRKVYFATRDPKGGAFKSVIDLSSLKGINHHPDEEEGCMKEECSQLLKEYFRKKRQ